MGENLKQSEDKGNKNDIPHVDWAADFRRTAEENNSSVAPIEAPVEITESPKETAVSQIKKNAEEAKIYFEDLKARQKAKTVEKSIGVAVEPIVVAPEKKSVERNDAGIDLESIHDAKPAEKEKTGDTLNLSDPLNETIIEKKDEAKNPAEDINNLLIQKKNIESQLSVEGLSLPEKEKLEQEKKETLVKVMEEAGKLLGRDLEKEITDEKEKYWEEGIKSHGYKSMKDYEAKYRENFYNETIQNSNLSEKQKREIFEEGGLIVSSWPSTIELTKEDVIIALNSGIDVNQIKRAGFFSKKIVSGDKILGSNIEDFNKRLAVLKSSVDEQIKIKMDQRKKEIIEKSIGDSVISLKISEVLKLITVEPKKEEVVSKEPDFQEDKLKDEPPKEEAVVHIKKKKIKKAVAIKVRKKK